MAVLKELCYKEEKDSDGLKLLKLLLLISTSYINPNIEFNTLTDYS